MQPAERAAAANRRSTPAVRASLGASRGGLHVVFTSNHTLSLESFDARQAEGPNGWYVETASLFRTTNPRLLVRHRQVSSEIYTILTCSMKGKLFNRIPQNVSRIVQSNTKLNTNYLTNCEKENLEMLVSSRGML